MSEEKTDGSSIAGAASGASPTTVKSIFIYPIKSCKGISVSKAPLSPTGFMWDRHWMVINSKGRGWTQMAEPKLALVQVELPIEAFSLGWEPNKSSYLVVRAPGMAELKVSLAKPCLRSNGVALMGWSGSALDEGDEAAKWFTDFLGKPNRLVRFNEELETIPVEPHYASGFKVQFSGGFPFLLISEASMDAVNEQLKELININRFRPKNTMLTGQPNMAGSLTSNNSKVVVKAFDLCSIFVNGCESFAEDMWKQIKINKLTFQGVMLCPRCKVITNNQEDGTRGSEPFETMMKFRSPKVLELNTTKSIYQARVYFGQLLVCLDDNKGKIVSVGDMIEVEKVFPSYSDVPV